MGDYALTLEGDLTATETLNEKNGQIYNTLDEPVSQTFLRDVKSIWNKILQVLIPRDKKSSIKEWDLWGPLFLCTALAVLLQGSDDRSYGDPEFAEVFVLVSIGAFVVTLNSQLIGGTLSFLQSVCVLGYCLLPSVLSLMCCHLVSLLGEHRFITFVARSVFPFLAFIWASYSALMFLGDTQMPRRRLLAAYPMCLFYFIISWLVMSHS